MALISKELTAVTMLNECVGVSSGGGPEEPSSKCLAYQGLCYRVVAAHTFMYLCQELPSFFFRYAPLEDPRGALFV